MHCEKIKVSHHCKECSLPSWFHLELLELIIWLHCKECSLASWIQLESYKSVRHFLEALMETLSWFQMISPKLNPASVALCDYSSDVSFSRQTLVTRWMESAWGVIMYKFVLNKNEWIVEKFFLNKKEQIVDWIFRQSPIFSLVTKKLF